MSKCVICGCEFYRMSYEPPEPAEPCVCGWGYDYGCLPSLNLFNWLKADGWRLRDVFVDPKELIWEIKEWLKYLWWEKEARIAWLKWSLFRWGIYIR